MCLLGRKVLHSWHVVSALNGIQILVSRSKLLQQHLAYGRQTLSVIVRLLTQDTSATARTFASCYLFQYKAVNNVTNHSNLHCRIPNLGLWHIRKKFYTFLHWTQQNTRL